MNYPDQNRVLQNIPWCSVLALFAFVLTLLISGCSTDHETISIDPEYQAKLEIEAAWKEKQKILKNLQGIEEDLKTLTFSPLPEQGDVLQFILEKPILSYKIAVLLPFSSNTYKPLASNVFKALALALFQKISIHKHYTLYPIDTGSTEKTFTQSLEELEKLKPDLVIGPLLTQNILHLFEKSTHFKCQFLALNSNPIFYSYDTPRNIWFMPPSLINEIKLLEHAYPDNSYFIQLPESTLSHTLDAVLKSYRSKPLISTPNKYPLNKNQKLYLPLYSSNINNLSNGKNFESFLGFDWLNKAQNTKQKKEGTLYQIQPKSPIPPQLIRDFYTYLYHKPSALELISYSAFQVATQLLDEQEQINATLAYRSILGPIYIDTQGFAFYDMAVKEI